MQPDLPGEVATVGGFDAPRYPCGEEDGSECHGRCCRELFVSGRGGIEGALGVGTS
jgi:hypothetical protein